MKLADAVASYVQRRRSEGSPFISSEMTLRSFCKQSGDLELTEVTADRVSRFVSNPRCSPITRISKFSAVKCFVDYFSVRGDMPSLLLQRPAKPIAARSPFIYTHAQVQQLLRAAGDCQTRATHISGETFRMVLLTLYATGMTVEEVLTLHRSDIDLRSGILNIGASCYKARRRIPIGTDFKGALAAYLLATRRPKVDDALAIFSTAGGAINRKNLCERFKRLHSTVGVKNSAGGGAPRLQDFRYTFAVHRVRSWLQAGADLNELLPSLSAYMGYASLTKSEEFLAYAPERFHENLLKLSPRKARLRWTDDPGLIAFLSSL